MILHPPRYILLPSEEAQNRVMRALHVRTRGTFPENLVYDMVANLDVVGMINPSYASCPPTSIPRVWMHCVAIPCLLLHSSNIPALVGMISADLSSCSKVGKCGYGPVSSHSSQQNKDLL